MHLAELTLSEQLKMTERRIEERKRLFGINDEDQRNMLSAKPFIDENLELIVERLYKQQLEFSEIQLVIGDADTLSRLKNSMRNYIQELFSGTYDAIYINTRLRVGKVHKRIGVSPSLYMQAVNRLIILLNEIIEAQCKDGSCSRIEAEARKISLSKLLMFDVHLVFETYTGALVAAVEVAQMDLEQYAQDLEITIAKRTQELKDLSRMDGLTGLLNQRAFFDHLRSDLSIAKRREESITLLYFDLNGFKKINDTQGHRTGDLVLAHVGESLLATMREIDTCCRYGGDEFCVILPSCQIEQAQEVCRRLVQRFEDKAGQYPVSFSIGISQVGPKNFPSVDEMVKSADKLMYLSKSESKKVPGYWICDQTDKVKLLLAKPNPEESSDASR
ncbi:MAG: GGDEF domain-containing protein [Magnetococcales bacterium]|nr:GGDEF domain-containing protein [Magnetococcales bacterium]